jgi:hypothetical protein
MSVSFEVFSSDVSEFRRKLGERSFWEQDEERRDRWFNGLSRGYMMMECESQQQALAILMMDSILSEYSRRTAFVLCHGLPERKGTPP